MDKDITERLPCYVQLLRNWYSEEEKRVEGDIKNGNRTDS